MPVAALVPILIVALGIVAYSYYDLARSSVRYLPKWAWALICLSVPIGTIVYFTVGREPG
jgi:hypothetical protein